MNLQQLHDHAATSLVNPKLGGAMCSVVTAWINCVPLDWGYTPHSEEWPSTGHNGHWLADPKATICELKCHLWGSKISGESSAKYQSSHQATKLSRMSLLVGRKGQPVTSTMWPFILAMWYYLAIVAKNIFEFVFSSWIYVFHYIIL